MLVKPRFKPFFAVFALSLVIAGFFVSPTYASNKAKLTCLKHHSQGATITKDYFLYTDRCSDSKVKIYKCNRKGTQISNCRKITQGAFKHANVLEHKWGSNYFWVLDSGGKSTISKSGHHWCYSLSGKSADDSDCGGIPNSSFPKSSLPKYHKGKGNKRSRNVPQGFAIYNNYRLKGIYNKNSIYIFRNNTRVKVLLVGSDPNELEDVMVEGDTGKIYFSTSGKGWVKLHSTSYKLPLDGNSNPSGSSGSGGSSGGDVQKLPEAQKAPTPHNDGSVETTFFGLIKDDGKGCGVFNVLNFIIAVLTFGIGITAIIGIMICGIQYLTAKGNVGQVTKSKNRFVQIVIGIALYACLWALLNFLLPGGKLNTNSQCRNTPSSFSSSVFASSDINHSDPKS